MLRNLQDEPRLATFHVQGIQDLRETLVKLRVNVNVMELRCLEEHKSNMKMCLLVYRGITLKLGMAKSKMGER